MGTLKDGVTYIYETVDGVTYAREFGSNSSTRVPIGWKYDARTHDGRPLNDHLMDDKLWGEIRRAALTHPGLRDELERVKMFYHLIKQDKQNNIDWHPV